MQLFKGVYAVERYDVREPSDICNPIISFSELHWWRLEYNPLWNLEEM